MFGQLEGGGASARVPEGIARPDVSSSNMGAYVRDPEGVMVELIDTERRSGPRW